MQRMFLNYARGGIVKIFLLEEQAIHMTAEDVQEEVQVTCWLLITFLYCMVCFKALLTASFRFLSQKTRL